MQQVNERQIRLRRRTELPQGGRSQEFHVGAAAYTNFDVARQTCSIPMTLKEIPSDFQRSRHV